MKSFFKPLCDAVDSLTDSQREEIFGRSYEEYASKCRFDYPDRHTNWINIQHAYTLEIRMPRFYSADAYMRFVKCFKKIFKALNTHYISKLHNDVNAKKAGRKMAMVFKNEYAEYFVPVSEQTNLLNGNAIGGITITADNSGISSINYSYDVITSNRGVA